MEITMMRLSRFTDYSLRVLIYLGQNNESRVTINQISEAYDISKNHLKLNQIMLIQICVMHSCCMTKIDSMKLLFILKNIF